MNCNASNFAIFLTLLLNNYSTMQAEEMYPVIAFERDHLRLHKEQFSAYVTLILLACFHQGATRHFRVWIVEQLGHDN